MYGDFQSHVAVQLEAIRAAGTFKRERVIVSPQDARIRVAGSDDAGGKSVLNMCGRVAGVWSASRRPGASLWFGTGYPAR